MNIKVMFFLIYFLSSGILNCAQADLKSFNDFKNDIKYGINLVHKDIIKEKFKKLQSLLEEALNNNNAQDENNKSLGEIVEQLVSLQEEAKIHSCNELEIEIQRYLASSPGTIQKNLCSGELSNNKSPDMYDYDLVSVLEKALNDKKFVGQLYELGLTLEALRINLNIWKMDPTSIDDYWKKTLFRLLQEYIIDSSEDTVYIIRSFSPVDCKKDK